MTDGAGAAGQCALLRRLASQAARAGGAATCATARDARPVTTKSSLTNPVTADGAESAVVEFLRRHRPDDGLLSEESGAVAGGSSGLRWVIDALDGSVNHLYGVPQSCVSVACERWDGDDGWAAVAGAVLDVGRDELFTAAAGAGADLDGAPIRVNDPVPAELALVAVE